MSKVIGEIHYKRYDDGTLELEAGGYPSLEQACHDLGDLLEPQIIKIAGEGEENFIARRELACDMVRAFVDGLGGSMDDASWKNPKKELPNSKVMCVLFALKTDGLFGPIVKRGHYCPETGLFYASNSEVEICTSKECYNADYVACWRPMPHPIKFDSQMVDNRNVSRGANTQKGNNE